MLILRNDWRLLPGGAVAVDLIAKVRGQKRRRAAAAHLIGASLDLLVATWPRETRLPLQVEALSSVMWRILDLYYIYLPPSDDGALAACIKLARASEVIVIVPRRHESLKRRILDAELGRRAPSVWSFDSFISWRTLSAEIDQRWPRGRAIVELLSAYNRRVKASGDDDSILFASLPAAVEGST